MSTFLRHEACPNCSSSDALAVFDDGHKFCFSCKHYEAGDLSIENKRRVLDRNPQVGGTNLPPDFDFNIHSVGLDWLRKYGLTQKESINHRFGWSTEGIVLKNKNIRVAPLLVFPIYDEVGHLLMWQGRNFGKEGQKYITRGAKKDVLHVLGQHHESDTIILTEDLISAIKVSRVAPAMPLWGSFMSLELARRLSTRFTKAVLWLDKDKAQEAVKQAANASHIFERGCSSIRTERDPKEYTTEEIDIYATD